MRTQTAGLCVSLGKTPITGACLSIFGHIKTRSIEIPTDSLFYMQTSDCHKQCIDTCLKQKDYKSTHTLLLPHFWFPDKKKNHYLKRLTAVSVCVFCSYLAQGKSVCALANPTKGFSFNFQWFFQVTNEPGPMLSHLIGIFFIFEQQMIRK